MVALLDKTGAYLYDCSANEFEHRLSEKIGDKERGTVDYTREGARRTDRDGMIGWLFPTSELIADIQRMGCDAVIVKVSKKEYKRLDNDEFPLLNDVYTSILYSKDKGGLDNAM